MDGIFAAHRTLQGVGAALVFAMVLQDKWLMLWRKRKYGLAIGVNMLALAAGNLLINIVESKSSGFVVGPVLGGLSSYLEMGISGQCTVFCSIGAAGFMEDV